MASTPVICGIDIGNTSVKVAIARFGEDGVTPEVIGVGIAPTGSGLRAGEVVDMKETTDGVRSALAQACQTAGVRVSKAYVSVAGAHVGLQQSRGTIAVARADGEITASDIERVLSTAQVVSLPQNREIIHVVPRDFTIDGTERVRDPLGMKGVRLEADVLLVHGLSRHLKNLAKCVNECGVGVAAFVYAPLASSHAVLDRHQKEFGVAHLDFGGGSATLSIWDQADMIHSVVLPIGSRRITNDLAILLKTSLENAERIKVEVGGVNEREDRRKRPEMLDLTSYMDEAFLLPRRQLISAIDARVGEMLEMTTAELKRIGKEGMLPAGVILSGGGSKLAGFAVLVRDSLGLPVRMAKPVGIAAFDAAMDPSFATALGLIVWARTNDGASLASDGGFVSPDVSGALRKVISWLKNFLP